MSTTVIGLDELDAEITVAWAAVGVARGRWNHCPSGENASRVADAEAEVDRLLDERLAAQR